MQRAIGDRIDDDTGRVELRGASVLGGGFVVTLQQAEQAGEAAVRVCVMLRHACCRSKTGVGAVVLSGTSPVGRMGVSPVSAPSGKSLSVPAPATPDSKPSIAPSARRQGGESSGTTRSHYGQRFVFIEGAPLYA
jgi:hypothetical protein